MREKTTVPARKYSVRFKVLILLLLIVIPIWMFSFIGLDYSIHLIKEQIVASHESSLKLYMNEVDTQLDSVQQYLYRVIVDDNKVGKLLAAKNHSDYMLQKYILYSSLKNDALLLHMVDSVFLYSVEYDDYLSVDIEYPSNPYENHKSIIMSHIGKECTDPNFPIGRWTVVPMGNEVYGFYVVERDGFYMGTWIEMDRILGLLQTEENEIPVLVDNEDRILTPGVLKGKDHYPSTSIEAVTEEYLVVLVPSSVGNFRLGRLLESRNILENLPLLQYVLLILSGTSLVCLILGMSLLRKMLLLPLQQLSNVTTNIAEENYDYRIPLGEKRDEFYYANRSINELLDTLHSYKIDIYEATINRQRVELQLLKLQIKPHFYLNTLNMIYTLSRTGKYEMVQELAYNLIQYFRYLFRQDFDMVTLGEELGHIRNYFQIQTLRYPDCLDLQIAAAPQLLEVKIPPLLIQPFVDNSVKHSLKVQQLLHIQLEVSTEDIDGQEMVVIQILDDGVGFSGAVLEKIQKNERIVDESGEHIGIWNICQRLQLIYGRKATVHLFNRESKGAGVRLQLPLTNREGEKDEHTVGR
ncbi:hypothetical protein B5F07_20220 [Lachnoclostridium sp. An169]|uniref:sensor histidine kinase n=1 Tax=Lachnoclostridium sp. An169 TaxID=1965569 RepID=UPI000B373C94|nr:histidine kinase [Lachnoclostridium sp. An169]OUP80672.1 hypothetical protein B5F07_20220 [Lachnoclostridium sp. An169]